MSQGMAAAQLGMKAGSAIASTISAYQSAKAFKKFQKAQIASILDNNKYQLRALKNRYNEETEAINQERQAVYLQNLQAKATAMTSAAGNGVEGTSLDSLFMGYDRATAINNYMSDKELRLKGLQLDDNVDALRMQAISSLYDITYQPDKTASTLLSGMGDLISTYANNYANTKTTKTEK